MIRTVVRALDRAAAWVEHTVLLVSLVLLACVTALQIASRELQLYTTWTLEVGSYLLVWMIFAGAALGVRERKHVRFDALVHTLPGSVTIVLDHLADVLVLGFAIFLLWTSTGLVERQFSWGQMTATLPVNINIGLTSIIMPLAGAFMIVHLLNRFLDGSKI